jgi:serine/threonine protein kinase
VILEDVCRALIFLHRAAPPLIHRDIKPANIMVTREKRGVLIDFDASKVYKEGKKEDTTLCGTAGTAAPEQYGFGQSDARTDIFAVGRLIGLMFPDDPDWKKVSEKASSFSPGDRYGSVSGMMEHFPSSGEEAEEKPARIPFLCRVPGFRTGKTENMAAALALYGIFLFCSLTLTVENASGPAEIWLNRIFTLLIGISWTALFTDLGFPFSRMPLLRSKNPLVRLISYLLAAALLFAAWITVLVFVSAALF